jgi:hypothetical protein
VEFGWTGDIYCSRTYICNVHGEMHASIPNSIRSCISASDVWTLGHRTRRYSSQILASLVQPVLSSLLDQFTVYPAFSLPSSPVRIPSYRGACTVSPSALKGGKALLVSLPPYNSNLLSLDGLDHLPEPVLRSEERTHRKLAIALGLA